MALFNFFKKKPAPSTPRSTPEREPPAVPFTPPPGVEFGGAAAPPPAPRPPLALPELDEPVPEGQRRILTLRFEGERKSEVLSRELTLDGGRVRVFDAKADARDPRKPTEVFDDHRERFARPEDARKHFQELAKEAWQGFMKMTREVRLAPAEPSPALVPVAVNPELEAAFENASESEAPKVARVLADWLQERGDPRGVCAAQLQQGQHEAARELFEARLLGELETAVGVELYDLKWREGFLVGASLKRRRRDPRAQLAALTRDFLKLPVARFVTALRFGLASYDSDNSWTETLRAVAESPRGPFVRELRFDDYGSKDCELSWTPFGDFSACWKKLPSLELVHLRSGAGGTLGELDLPNLKTFVRESTGLSAEEIGSVLAARWPRLEKLELWLGTEEYGTGCSVELLRPLLDGKVPPSLKHLGLVNCEFAPEELTALLRSKVLRQLEVLDLSKGVLMDQDVEILLANQGAVRHLRRLDLSENLLDESVARLKEALPNLEVGEQRSEEDEGRFTAVGE
ncbi:MAG: hypothetical protein QM765_46915 [Myxococcales bacterium]